MNVTGNSGTKWPWVVAVLAAAVLVGGYLVLRSGGDRGGTLMTLVRSAFSGEELVAEIPLTPRPRAAQPAATVPAETWMQSAPFPLQVPLAPRQPAPALPVRLLLSEVMAGSAMGSEDEFIELFNAGAESVSLTGWSLRRRAATGSESALVSSSRLGSKVVSPGRYFLLVNDGGYRGGVAPDARWASSNTFAYASNTIMLYNPRGEAVDRVSWSKIPPGQSLGRQWWDKDGFVLQPTPTPQNSSGN